MERGLNRPKAEISSPACPRCGSSNTKFCYYNNYSLTQPRYFCKACRRYWTKGGSLRKVPVGGGCRKSRSGKSIHNGGRNLLSSLNNIEINNNNGIVARVSDVSTATATTAIDLAAVYANYLNQAPQSDHHHHPHNDNYNYDYDRVKDHESLLLSEFSTERSGIINQPVGFSSSEMNHLSSQGNEFFESGPFPDPQLFGNNFSGLNNSTVGNAMLPALPGERILWASKIGSDVIMEHQILSGPAGTVEQSAGNYQNISPGAFDGNASPFSPLINLEAIFRS